MTDFRPSYEEYGQMLPAGDGRGPPHVADHAAFDAENRERARAAVDSACPAVGAVRVLTHHDPADVRARLADRPLVVWADGDRLHVLWRGAHRAPMVNGGLQGLPLWPVDGVDGAWSISFRFAGTEDALVTVMVHDGDSTSWDPTNVDVVFRGARRPAPREESEAAGRISADTIASRYLDTPRTLRVYRHPRHRPGDPVVLVADGGNVHAYAPVAEAAIDDGRCRPVMLVGIDTSEHRHLEYLRPHPDWLAISGHDAAEHERRHLAHHRFVLDEVIPHVTGVLGGTGPVFVQGNSNGAAWAVDICDDEPERFAGAIAFSVAGMQTSGPARAGTGTGHRHVLAAGTLETGFLSNTDARHEALRAAGVDATLAHRVNGHDWRFWREEFVSALALIGA